MRWAQALVLLCLAVSVTARAQDDRLPVIRPQVEVVKESPAPFPIPDKQASDYDTWIRTPWVPLNRAKCDPRCVLVSVHTNSGAVAKIDVTGARKGVAKLRLALAIPATCGESVWYGELKDESGTGVALTDPSDNPIPQSRIHVFRFDEVGREISMVFQNEHTGTWREARLKVLCKAKPADPRPSLPDVVQ